jgi:hypothetical protein
MYFQRINRTDPEKVFVVCKNARSTALTSGQPVCWAYNGTDDGLAVTIPATAILALVAGITEGTIAGSGYGLIQAYGHNANALVTGTTDVAVGDKLACKDAVLYLIKAAGTLVAGESGCIVAGQAFTTAGALAKKVFVRCM